MNKKEGITFREYQEEAHKTAVYPIQHRYVYPIVGLASEAGEVLGKYKKYLRENKTIYHLVDELKKELGDVLWYIAEICTVYGIDLEEVAVGNNEKLRSRKERNVLEGDGDNR